jgi:hypothetical protein
VDKEVKARVALRLQMPPLRAHLLQYNSYESMNRVHSVCADAGAWAAVCQWTVRSAAQKARESAKAKGGNANGRGFLETV